MNGTGNYYGWHYEVMLNGKLYEKVDNTNYEGSTRLLWIARDIAIHDLKGKGTVEFVGQDYGEGPERKKSMWIEKIEGDRYTYYRRASKSYEKPILWLYDAAYNMILGYVEFRNGKYYAEYSVYEDWRFYFDCDTHKEFLTEYSAIDYIKRRIRRR